MVSKKGIIFAVITILFWATLGTSFKIFAANIDGLSASIYVGVLATLFIFIYILLARKTKEVIPELKKSWKFFIIAGIIGLGIQQVTYFMAYKLLPVSQAVIMYYIFPLLMILISAMFFKEKINLKSILLVFLGFIGLYVIISNGTLIKLEFNLGIILVLIASVSWALFSVLIKHKKFDVVIGMFYFNLFGTLSLFLLIPFYGFTYKLTSLEIIGFIYIALFPTALCFIFWNKALRLLRTSIASNLILADVILSIIFASILLKERLSLPQVIGSIIILVSILLNINLKNHSIKKSSSISSK